MKSLLFVPLLFAFTTLSSCKEIATVSADSEIAPFVAFFSYDSDAINASKKLLEENWEPGYGIIALETMRFASSPEAEQACLELLTKAYGVNHGNDADAWYQEIWKRPEQRRPEYPQFKAILYSQIDPSFKDYFKDEDPTTIRLDEIRWGGVRRDGIPPLKDPKTIPASEATYLADSDVVFGANFNGEARAYPKRILAWHEMVKDTIGGQKINGVYCTLCNSMIVYDPGKYELGTSGFLYRSNKLMYDHKTRSLWSTLAGKPVVGKLVGKGIELEPLYVVTTTWGEWKKLYPQTTTLSLDTGYRRDYGEGVAYHDYFASPNLMFKIADGLIDKRLPVKEEVFVLRNKKPVAFTLDYLKKNPTTTYGDVTLKTDPSGATRAYRTGTEERAPAHNAFWFAIASENPGIELIQ